MNAIDTANVEQLVAAAMSAWRPPPRLKLSEWADQHYYLSAESAADPGRWHTLPYQREPMDAFTDPTVTQVTFMKSARVGYTKIIGAVIAYHVHQDPCPIMVVQPTLPDAKGYSKEEIGPLIRDVPVLEERFAPFKNSLLHKRFKGGLLQIVGASSAGSFRRVSRRVLLLDEVDGYPPSVGNEGDQIKLAIRRTEYYWNRKIGDGSTPTLAGASRIELLFAAGDQRRYHVPCSQCGHMDYLVFRRETADVEGKAVGHFMKWDQPDGSDAHFVCSSCGGVIEEKDKRGIIERGEWRAAAPFTGHASFHIWAAYSYSPNATWAQLVAEYLAANREGVEQLKTYVNTVLGETWKDKGEAPDWERLYERRETYPAGTCQRSVLFLTAGVDVQKDRLVYEVVGWGRGKRSWSVDAFVIPGDTSDESAAGPWSKLDALLERSFHHELGADLRIAKLAVDSGFNTQVVYNWARRHGLSRVIAVKGTDRAGMLLGTPSKVDVTRGGKRIGYRVWPIGTPVAKSELYGWLKLPRPTDAAIAAGEVHPPGFCRFPQYDEEYFKQLTAERLVGQRIHTGFVIYVWELQPGHENHFLDCRVYARAAAAVFGVDRFSESDWAALEKAIGHEPPPAPPTPSTGDPPPAAQTPRAAVQRDAWIRRRPGYLQKGR
jgi:phage terminase large subunit GpA-like protein